MYIQLTEKRNKKKKKKKKGKNYFTQDTEDAIVEFQQNEGNLRKQELLFITRIQPAFEKLIENLMFVYKFHRIDDIEILKVDCLSSLFEKIGKYDQSKGYPAFSYFNIVARNWFFQKQKEKTKQNNKDIRLNSEILRSLENNNDEMIIDSCEVQQLRDEFYDLLKDDVRSWRKKLDKDYEQKVLEAVILLLENVDMMSDDMDLNKKSIYLCLREITGMNQKQIASNLNKLKKKYKIFKKRYHKGSI